MKQMIIIFIIGFLAGAIIATGIFYIYSTTVKQPNTQTDTSALNDFPMPDSNNGQTIDDNNSNKMPDSQNGGNNQFGGSNSRPGFPGGNFPGGQNGNFSDPPQRPDSQGDSSSGGQLKEIPKDSQNNSGENNQNS